MHFWLSCHLVSGLKIASLEDLIKARVDAPGGGPQGSRVGVGGRLSELELPEAAAPRNCSEAGRVGGWAEAVPLSFSGLSHSVAAPGRVGGGGLMEALMEGWGGHGGEPHFWSHTHLSWNQHVTWYMFPSSVVGVIGRKE